MLRRRLAGAYERLFAAQRPDAVLNTYPGLSIAAARARTRCGDGICRGETLEALVGRLGATPDYARELYPVLCEAVGELHAGFAAAGEPGVPVTIATLNPRTSSYRA